jgi:hypothetical protein
MRSTAGSSDYTHILTFRITPLNVNWVTLIHDMKERGISFLKQSESIGEEWPTFQRWLRGGGTRFHNGHALLILHSKVCGIELTQKRIMESLPK